MAEYLIQDSTLTSLADKIRVLNGSEEPMSPAGMGSKLDAVAEKAIMLGEKTILVKLPTSESLQTLVSGNGLIMALINGACDYIYSSDGITWNQGKLPEEDETGYPIDQWSSLVFGDGKFVAIIRNKAVYSSDGINWTFAEMPDDFYGNYNSLAYGNGKFIAIAMNDNYTASVVYSSVDGTQWSYAGSIPDTNEYYAELIHPTWCNNRFIAFYDYALGIVYSQDGISWYSANTPSSYAGRKNWKGVAYGNGIYLATDSYGASFLYSSDGITWSEIPTPDGEMYWSKVVYAEDKFVVINESKDLVAYSNDGINWNIVSLPISGTSGKLIVYDGNKFIVTGGYTDAIAISEDGTSWSNTITIASLNKCDGTDVTEETIDVVIGDDIDTQADLIAQIGAALESKISLSIPTKIEYEIIEVAPNEYSASYSLPRITHAYMVPSGTSFSFSISIKQYAYSSINKVIGINGTKMIYVSSSSNTSSTSTMNFYSSKITYSGGNVSFGSNRTASTMIFIFINDPDAPAIST